MSAAGISGASRKAGFGEGTPQQVSREGQNRRIADFGTVVETCSKTAADCSCPGFSVHRANRAGLSARCARSFFLSPKIHLKGRQLPAVRGFFKFSFALVIRETGFWQPAGQRIFPFTPYNTSKGKNDGNSGNFLFASKYGQISKMPNGQQKKQQIFFRLTAFAGRWWRLVFSFLLIGQSET
jgi:hypothetical protein